MGLESGMSIKWSGKHYQDPCTKLYPYAGPGGGGKTSEAKYEDECKKLWEAQKKRDEKRTQDLENLCKKNREEERRIDNLPSIDSYHHFAFMLSTLAYGMKESLKKCGPVPGDDYTENVAQEAIGMIVGVARLDAGLSTGGDQWHRRRNSFRGYWADVHTITEWIQLYARRLCGAGSEWAQKAIAVRAAGDRWESLGKGEKVRMFDLIDKVLEPENWPELWPPRGTRQKIDQSRK
jgi:hypothetical protein